MIWESIQCWIKENVHMRAKKIYQAFFRVSFTSDVALTWARKEVKSLDKFLWRYRFRCYQLAISMRWSAGHLVISWSCLLITWSRVWVWYFWVFLDVIGLESINWAFYWGDREPWGTFGLRSGMTLILRHSMAITTPNPWRHHQPSSIASSIAKGERPGGQRLTQ